MLTRPFLGSVAIARGLLTPGLLRGPRFRRLFPDVYVRSDVEVDLALLSEAAFVLTRGRGVLGGWSAAEVLGASCGPLGAPAEIVVPGRRRARPGLVVREEVLPDDEVVEVDGMLATIPLRAAFDLGRRPPLVEAVVAVDALARVGRFAPRDLVAFGYGHLGARGSRLLAAAVARADARSGSPMETRIRMALVDGGLPAPVLQHVVGPYELDLAHPDFLLAVEYDGRDHLTQERAMRDLARQAHLSRLGWDVLRSTAADVLLRPRSVAARVRSELVRRGAPAA
ncbi:endonuclease domain-containing protein [Pseudonocardia broussonetiae]|uniref:DUF559 domain-containing protein n=1 Tax=Pseudonocardia broussonetiae TaxID=2736640 RepID=A0A6M6JHS1_9PSEU|nr:DUF559 domain-containing protein [Pseudonocardia broussonetiae]QJY46723.1 DUF559 domain-containing protein [Pseudonocardia broussonetiae]